VKKITVTQKILDDEKTAGKVGDVLYITNDMGEYSEVMRELGLSPTPVPKTFPVRIQVGEKTLTIWQAKMPNQVWDSEYFPLNFRLR